MARHLCYTNTLETKSENINYSGFRMSYMLPFVLVRFLVFVLLDGPREWGCFGQSLDFYYPGMA